MMHKYMYTHKSSNSKQTYLKLSFLHESLPENLAELKKIQNGDRDETCYYFTGNYLIMKILFSSSPYSYELLV